MSVEERAKIKLKKIIEREGDEKGERLKAYYLQMIVDEIKQQDKFSYFAS